ncbi:hypothetical protein PENTCL1PPCAC_10670, partial [Pristionchus entomophagus]
GMAQLPNSSIDRTLNKYPLVSFGRMSRLSGQPCLGLSRAKSTTSFCCCELSFHPLVGSHSIGHT